MDLLCFLFSFHLFYILHQLSDAISIIGREDFPKKWPDLLPEMVSKFETGDFNVINGVLHTAHSLFKRYFFSLLQPFDLVCFLKN